MLTIQQTNKRVCVYSNSRDGVPRVAQRYGTIAAHTRRRASVLVVFVVFACTCAVLPVCVLLFSSSELTGCGYPGLLDRKNRSDMCPRWESNPRLPVCKASILSTRPGSPLTNQRCDSQNLYIVVGLSVAYYANRKIILFVQYYCAFFETASSENATCDEKNQLILF